MTPSASDRSGTELEFEIRHGAHASRRRVCGPAITIGRRRESTLAFPDDATVSRDHAEISVTAAGCLIAERNTLNHTYVNGARLTAPRSLAVGDTISLGSGGPQLKLLAIVEAAAAAGPVAVERPVQQMRERPEEPAPVAAAARRRRVPAPAPRATGGTTLVHRLNARLDRFARRHRALALMALVTGLAGVVGAAVGGKMLYDEFTKVRPTDWVALGERLQPGLAYVFVDKGKTASNGSGFLVDGSGLVATNYHVIDGAEKVKVQFADGDAEFASPGYVFADPVLDLAVIKVDLPDDDAREPFRLSESQVRALQPVAVLGSPSGLRHVLSQGTVQKVTSYATLCEDLHMKLEPERRDMTVIVHGAAMGPGNSGGPLVDEHGEVIGINSWEVDSLVEITSSTTGQVRTRDFKFAVHVKYLRKHLPKAGDDVREYETLPR